MQLIRTLECYQSMTAAVATIGNFDGVHLGHQMIARKLIEKSQTLNLPSMVITFEPTAQEFFLKEHAPGRLTNFREKFSLLRDIGVDQFVCLRFDQALAKLSARSFVHDILVNTLKVRSLVVGDNFRFGSHREGDFKLLQALGAALDYQVEDSDSFIYNKQRVSSTLIRERLANGELDAAELLLGRPYSMTGKIVHGAKRGRTIGFPTANIPIRRIRSAVSGVFAVEILLENGSTFQGVANMGHRPTVNSTKTQLEVHIFRFSQDIYGEHIKVTFRKKIREEKKFSSLDALKRQIQNDSKATQTFFNTTP